MSAPVHDHHHAVQFYGDDRHLFTTVAGFLGQGFVDAHPAIVIATPDHATAILECLQGRMIDVERAQSVGDLVVLDADETLALFMEGDHPSAARFEESVGELIREILSQRSDRTLIRAYGEMVDVLWKQGRPEAAVRLEMLWNKLANQHGFALLCGYSMGNFFEETALFEEVCRQHTHVMPPEPSRPDLPSRKSKLRLQ
jgi:MEDS: MEthanogen/methylotroph, DcmR Sensory domain